MPAWRRCTSGCGNARSRPRHGAPRPPAARRTAFRNPPGGLPGARRPHRAGGRQRTCSTTVAIAGDGQAARFRTSVFEAPDSHAPQAAPGSRGHLLSAPPAQQRLPAALQAPWHAHRQARSTPDGSRAPGSRGARNPISITRPVTSTPVAGSGTEEHPTSAETINPVTTPQRVIPSSRRYAIARRRRDNQTNRNGAAPQSSVPFWSAAAARGGPTVTCHVHKATLLRTARPAPPSSIKRGAKSRALCPFQAEYMIRN